MFYAIVDLSSVAEQFMGDGKGSFEHLPTQNRFRQLTGQILSKNG